MWRAIDTMGKELKELAWWDAGMDDDSIAKQVLMNTNSAEDKPTVLEVAISIASQSIQETIGPTPHINFSISQNHKRKRCPMLGTL